MALMSLAQYREMAFEEGSRPDIRTLRRWLELGKLPIYGKRIGKKYYVDPARTPEPAISHNPLVLKVLSNGASTKTRKSRYG